MSYLKIVCITLCMWLGAGFASGQSWQWAQTGCISSINFPTSVIVDAHGNYITAGGCRHSSNMGNCSPNRVITKFDPNGGCVDTVSVDFSTRRIVKGQQGSYFIVGDSANKIIIRKFDKDGLVVWTKSASAPAGVSIYAEELADDTSGNIYITGTLPDTICVFDTMVIDSKGYFIAKYTSLGKCLWVKTCSGYITGGGISTDGAGNSYVTGYFKATAIFDTISLTSRGAVDVFVAKFNGAGSCLWAKQAGGKAPVVNYSQDAGYAIAATLAGNVYVTGSITDTAMFESGQVISTPLHTHGNSVFVAKYNTQGKLLWVNRYGIYYDNEGYCLATDAAENCYVGGTFINTIVIGGYTLHAIDYNDYDLFIAKLDADGNALWAKGAGSGSWNDSPRGIALDGNDLVTAGIMTGDTAWFDNIPLTSISSQNAFIAKISNITDIVEPIPANGQLSIYPNPTANKLMCKAGGNLQNSTIQFFGVDGRVATHSAVVSGNGFETDVSNLAAGLYFIVVQSQTQRYTGKFVKQ